MYIAVFLKGNLGISPGTGTTRQTSHLNNTAPIYSIE